jgi:hypothetical protein
VRARDFQRLELVLATHGAPGRNLGLARRDRLAQEPTAERERKPQQGERDGEYEHQIHDLS